MKLEFIKRKLFIVPMAFLLLIIGLLLLLHTHFIKSRILQYALNYLEQRQNIHLTVQSLDYNLLMFQFTLKGVLLRDLNKEKFPPFFQAEEIKIRIPLSLILRKKLQIQELDIQNPKINIHIDQDGTNNIPYKIDPEMTTPILTIISEFVFKQFWIKNAQLRFVDQVRNIELELPAVQLELYWLGEGKHSLLLQMSKKGYASLKRTFYPIDDLKIVAHHDYKGIDFKKFNLTLAQNIFEFAGRLDYIVYPSLNGVLQGKIDLNDIRPFIPTDKAFSGMLHFRSQLQGSLDTISARFKLESKNLHLEELQDIALKADIQWKDKLLLIKSIHIAIAGGEVQGNGELHPLHWEDGNRINLEWKSINLEHFNFFYDLPCHFASRTSGSFEAFWSNFSLNSVKGRSDIQLHGVDRRNFSCKRVPLSGRIITELDSGIITLSMNNLSIPGALLDGEFNLGMGMASGRFKLDARDIKALSPFILSFFNNLYKKEIEKLDIDGQISISGILEGTSNSPLIKAELKSKKISIQNLRNIELDGTLIYDSNMLRFDPIWLREDEAKIKISGFYQLRPSGQSMHFDVTGKQLSLEKILKSFNLDLPAKSQIDLKALIEGRPNDPVIKSSLIFTEASFYNQNYAKLELSGTYRNKEIILDSLKAEKSGGSIEAKGWYNIEKESYNVNLSINSLLLEDFQVSESFGRIGAIIDLRLEAKGTLHSPHIVASSSLRHATYNVREIGDLQIQANSLGEELKFQIMLPQFSGAMKGYLRLTNPYLLNAELEFINLSLEELKSRILSDKKLALSGNLRADVSLRIELSNPKDTLDIQAHVGEFHIKTAQHQLKNDSPFIISYDSTSLRIENLLLSGTGMKVQAEGSLPLKLPSSQGLYLSANIDLSLISSFLNYIDGKGQMKIEAEAIGAISDLELSAGLDLSGAKFTLMQLPANFEDVRLRIKVAKNMMNIESFFFRLENGEYELNGNIPLESLPLNLPGAFRIFGKRTANILFNFHNFDPSVLKLLFSNEIFQQIRGKIDGKIEVKGERIQLKYLSAEAILDTLELDIFGIPILQEKSTHILLNSGKVMIQRLILSGDENRLSIMGSAGVDGTRSLDLFIDGDLDLRMLQAFIKDTLISGSTIFQVHVSGNFDNPRMQGFVEIQNSGLQMGYPGVFLDQLNGRIQLDQNRLRVEWIHGDLNGGELKLNGDIGLSKRALSNAKIFLSIDDSLFGFPKDLHSQISSNLNFESNGKEHFLNGRVTIVNAKYTERLSIESAIFRYLLRGTVTEALRKPDHFLNNLYFNVEIITEDSIFIDNNISKSEINADLKLAGTFYIPVLAGRVNFVEGGEIYFSQNTFLIERGTVNFINPNQIEPDLDLSARTRINEYDIQLLLAGTPNKLSASFVSDPPLSEPNIIALLVSGKTLESTSASMMNVAGNKALSYINSAITGKIEQATAKSLGLESVRIDASLVSMEENPGARITVGQHIARGFELVFSQDLKDAQNRTWILNYNPLRNINLQGVKRDNNQYNFAVRHELDFDVDDKKRKNPLSRLTRKGLTVEKIGLDGNLGLPEKKIRKQIELIERKNFDFYKLQESLTRIRMLYLKNNYLSFTLNTKKEEKNGRMNLIFHIESGPKIFLKYQGAKIPKKLQKEIMNIWIGSSFGQMVKEDIKHRLRLHLLKKRYYQVTIHTEESVNGKNEIVIIFQIDKGINYDRPAITYEGNRFFSKEKLTSFLKKSHFISSIFVNPDKVAKNLENFYVQNGFLQSKVHTPKISFSPERRKVHVSFHIEEGTQFKVGQIILRGNQFFGDKHIINEINIQPGDIISLRKFNDATLEVREIYAQKGFNDVRVQSQMQVHGERDLVDLIFDIYENHQGKIAEIRISGNSITHKNAIQRALMFKEGDEVNFQKINETRKRLYDLGIFERVNIKIDPVRQDKVTSYERSEGQSDFAGLYRTEIDVLELKRYRLRYGLQFDTESSFGITGNLINRNFLGKAQLLGSSFRLNRDERDVRGFFRSSYFFSKRINTEFFTFINRSIKPSFTVDRIGFTFQQQIEFSKFYILSYDYTFERNHTFDSNLEGNQSIDTTVNVGTLSAALTRDTRDDILNASRGMFLSHGLGYAPGLLSSDVRFIRYFVQYYTFNKLNDFLIHASGLRIGLSKGLGQDLIPSERFFAGGGTTMRGFEKDEVGPKNPYTGLAEGGEAVFVLNQELRFPLYKELSGVVFVDLGNVYSKASDFNPFTVRKAAGFGLRFNTRFVLLRFDWGFKLDRRPGESLSKVFFSIGQAF